MSNFIFSLGIINKTLLLPTFYIIINIAIYIYFKLFYNEAACLYEWINASIGITLMVFISAKYKYKRINHKKKKKGCCFL